MSRGIKRKDDKIKRDDRNTRRRWLEIRFSTCDREIREKEQLTKKPVYGYKMQILNAYKQSGKIEDAYKIAEEINSKFKKEIYPKEVVKRWIEEEYGIKIKDKEASKEDRNEEDDAR